MPTSGQKLYEPEDNEVTILKYWKKKVNLEVHT